MKSNARLDSAVFHLTPTRTRCDLFIVANGKKEKIASGLLNPFLAHLKTARDQIEKGGYSIVLEPENVEDASWFTKGTVERFVRFVSTPEILERVDTIELEILQIQEAITIQGRSEAGENHVEDHEGKHIKGNEGSKTNAEPNDERAIVLYEPEAHQAQTNGQISQEGNSKAQLLKVLETRKNILRKEQGMAFARAIAAGFDVDQMALLVSFAECFGASRLLNACLKFVNLWKRKHETGQWVEIEASEALAGRSDFSAMNASGIVFSRPIDDNLALENNEKSGGKQNHQAPVNQQEYFQGQFPNGMFPSWPMHPPPGSLPMFPPYPVQGMPYYQGYPGGVPFYQPPYSQVDDHRLSSNNKTPRRRHSVGGGDDNNESETWESGSSKSRSEDDAEFERDPSESRQSRKKSGRSGKKQSGTVVIRNINYITAKKKNTANSDSESGSSESGSDGEDIQGNDGGKTSRSSKRRGSHPMVGEDYERENFNEKETDGGHWQAFQSFLLKGVDEESHTAKEGMFAMENAGKTKRRQNNVVDDPLALGGLESSVTQDRRMGTLNEVHGNRSRLRRGSDDGVMLSGGYNDARGTDDQIDMHSAETKGRRVISRNTNDDFMIGRREDYPEHGSLDPLSVNRFDRVNSKLGGESSRGTMDESFIVPFRSMSLDGALEDRAVIDMNNEMPSGEQKSENISGGKRRHVYEPDDVSLIPERDTENNIGYDPALDYEMHAGLDNGAKQTTNGKANTKKSVNGRNVKGTSDTLDKKRVGGPIRKGKPSKTSPLEDARARADKIRAFKADVQKLKKEKEEADLKRLEALKLERQKRIAARANSTTAASTSASSQTRKLPSKPSPIPYKGSKFSDSEPGSSSPLQRSKVRTSVGSNDSRKSSKPSKLFGGSPLPGTRLTRSVSSLSEQRKESSGVTPDSKASIARIKRLSEPRNVSNQSATSTKVQPRSASKLKSSEGPDGKKISAIMNLDKSKGATLPELKLKTPTGQSNAFQNKALAGKNPLKNDEVKHSAPSGPSEPFIDNSKLSQDSDIDDNPIVEKNIVVLENDKPSTSVVDASVQNFGPQNLHFESHEMPQESQGVPRYAAVPEPPASNGVRKVTVPGQLQLHSDIIEVKSSSVEDLSKTVKHTPAEKPYAAPYARASSLEDPCTRNTDYSKAPPLSSGITPAVKVHVPSERSPQVDFIPESLAQIQVKESPKGLRRLLKFGKKSHSSAAADQSNESDTASIKGHDAGAKVATSASSEAHTLKNLISEDETNTPGKASHKCKYAIYGL
ncbi:OLC1v1019674C1 [Oldenlandia corymbosa var. corymbosa]|uniref:OLC1v1019674C1 n=1 Tax=Oldenlandia corymbosa var. corymbosa TaxID=529605 RepID=A0AAV1EEZ4_OLDCO|nr:OLC1v1019674C1 [Oldenlandia corymbosa var. corymbosa]